MPYCDSDYDAVWRDANYLLNEAYVLLTKLRQDHLLVSDEEFSRFFSRFHDFDNECDKRNIVNYTR